jgi:hypothetical protein
METPDTLANLLEDIVCPGLDELLAIGQEILTPRQLHTVERARAALEEIEDALRERAALEEQRQLVLEITT